MPVYGRNKFYWYKDSLSEVDEDPPIVSTYYDGLDTTRLTKVLFIATRRLDDDANQKNLQGRLTIDGVITSVANKEHNDNTWYYWYLDQDAETLRVTTSIYHPNYYSAIEGRSIKFDAQQVDAPGANAEFDIRVQYETWRPT